MNTRLNKRLKVLETQYLMDRPDPVEAAEERLRRGALCTLSPDELEVLIDYARQLQEDPGIKPNPAQAAALEIYEQRYREFQSSGKLVANGRPVEV